MRQPVKPAIAACASLVLSGCVIVGSVTPGVTDAKGTVATGHALDEGTRVTVPAGGSISIYLNFLTPKQCTLTYTTDFVVPSECPAQDEGQQKRPDSQNPGAPGAEGQTPAPGSDTPPPGGATGTSGTTGSSGIAPPGTGPVSLATSVPAFSNFVPIVKNALTLAGALAIAKEVHDQTNGDKKDEPVSK